MIVFKWFMNFDRYLSLTPSYNQFICFFNSYTLTTKYHNQQSTWYFSDDLNGEDFTGEAMDFCITHPIPTSTSTSTSTSSKYKHKYKALFQLVLSQQQNFTIKFYYHYSRKFPVSFITMQQCISSYFYHNSRTFPISILVHNALILNNRDLSGNLQFLLGGDEHQYLLL